MCTLDGQRFCDATVLAPLAVGSPFVLVCGVIYNIFLLGPFSLIGAAVFIGFYPLVVSHCFYFPLPNIYRYYIRLRTINKIVMVHFSLVRNIFVIAQNFIVVNAFEFIYIFVITKFIVYFCSLLLCSFINLLAFFYLCFIF